MTAVWRAYSRGGIKLKMFLTGSGDVPRTFRKAGNNIHPFNLQKEGHMKVVVQDNQIEKAIRDLKKKLTKEGFFSEIKERRFYDKPSVQRKKKQAKAAKRRRKRMRKVY
jgi:small subunit ribosomal protein S21